MSDRRYTRLLAVWLSTCILMVKPQPLWLWITLAVVWVYLALLIWANSGEVDK